MRIKIFAGFLLCLFTPLVALAKGDDINSLRTGRWVITEMHLQQSNDNSILFFGDSLVQGMEMGDLPFKPINMGVGGFTIDEINLRINDVDISKYPYIISDGGVNDILFKKTDEQIKSSLVSLFKTMSKARIFYYSEILPMGNNTYHKDNDRVKKINTIISELCSSYKNCKLITSPKEMWSIDNSRFYLPDSVHLSTEGFRSWKGQIKKYVTTGVN